VSIIGSFRQHYDEVTRAAAAFTSAGIEVLSPKISRIMNPGSKYVRFESDPPSSSDQDIQATTFERLFASNLIYVVAPNGYVGPTTSFELGRCLERDIPIYFSEQPADLAVALPSTAVLDPASLIKRLTSKHPRRPRVKPNLSADLVVLTLREGLLHVLMVGRGTEPFRGMLALPGGFLRPGESLEDTAHRELEEETGLVGSALPLRQLATYSEPDRDPRGRVVTTAFLAVASDLPEPTAGSDARNADWVEVETSLRDRLAFGHARILDDAVAQAGALLENTPIALDFCNKHFKLSDLRRVYEAIWGVPLDPRSFARKVDNVQGGFVEPIGKKQKIANGRPAQLYRRGKAKRLTPPILPPRSRQSAKRNPPGTGT
jgi:ADP-ribose pyrophosphatase YjhB (NUDIX family)